MKIKNQHRSPTRPPVAEDDEKGYLENIIRSGKWQRAICPICEREYLFHPEYKPMTCLQMDCVKEMRHRHIVRLEVSA